MSALSFLKKKKTAYSSQILLRTVSDSFALQEVTTCDILLQSVLITLPLLVRLLSARCIK